MDCQEASSGFSKESVESTEPMGLHYHVIEEASKTNSVEGLVTVEPQVTFSSSQKIRVKNLARRVTGAGSFKRNFQ